MCVYIYIHIHTHTYIYNIISHAGVVCPIVKIEMTTQKIKT